MTTDQLLAALGIGLNLPLLLALGSLVKTAIDWSVKRYNPPDWVLVSVAVALSAFVAVAETLIQHGELSPLTIGMAMRDAMIIWAWANGITVAHNDARERAEIIETTALRATARTAWRPPNPPTTIRVDETGRPPS